MTRVELQQLWLPLFDNLVEKARLVPADHPALDQPFWSGEFQKADETVTEQSLTPRELLAHLAVAACEVPHALLGGGDFTPVREAFERLKTVSPEAIADEIAAGRERISTLLDGLDQESLDKLVTTPFGDRPVSGVLLFSALHVEHHKGQLMLALRLLGVRPGRFI